jgi:IPT/TIG domain-containing protein
MGQTMPGPITAAMLAVANANCDRPRYSTMADWAGGVKGDDVDTRTATVALATASGAAPYPDYAPRTQAAKATLQGTTLVTDVARARGWIGPGDPYVGNAPVAPVVASISPTTGPATSLPMTVTITGTGFTPWSVVRTGGSAVADPTGVYLSPTTMKVALTAAVPGTVSVAVEDHDLLSNTNVLFTVT